MQSLMLLIAITAQIPDTGWREGDNGTHTRAGWTVWRENSRWHIGVARCTPSRSDVIWQSPGDGGAGETTREMTDAEFHKLPYFKKRHRSVHDIESFPMNKMSASQIKKYVERKASNMPFAIYHGASEQQVEQFRQQWKDRK